MGGVFWSCNDVSFTCVNHPYGLYACWICMASIMVVVMSPCESGDVVVVKCVVMSV